MDLVKVGSFKSIMGTTYTVTHGQFCVVGYFKTKAEAERHAKAIRVKERARAAAALKASR